MKTDEFGDEVVEELKIHLVNRTDIAYKFIYNLNYFGKSDFELKNEILPFQDFYLHDISFESLNDSPSFEFEFSLLILFFCELSSLFIFSVFSSKKK